jgi:hypothetical protein
MLEIETIVATCVDCEEPDFIPKSFNQTWYVCWDCGLFREAEKQNAK